MVLDNLADLYFFITNIIPYLYFQTKSHTILQPNFENRASYMILTVKFHKRQTSYPIILKLWFFEKKNSATKCYAFQTFRII